MSGAAARAVLPDRLRPRLRVVFCGSAVGPVSARVGAYYAGPGNRFWPTLHAIGLTPRRFAPHEYPDLLALGIGLTDLAKRRFGVDSPDVLADYDAAALRRKIRRAAPGVLAFTAKTPAQAFLGRPCGYGLQDERIGDTELFVLPSTSGRAVRFWNIAPWQALAAHLARPGATAEA